MLNLREYLKRTGLEVGRECLPFLGLANRKPLNLLGSMDGKLSLFMNSRMCINFARFGEDYRISLMNRY